MDNVAGSCRVAQIDLHRFLPLCAALCQPRYNACGGASPLEMERYFMAEVSSGGHELISMVCLVSRLRCRAPTLWLKLYKCG
jgi:hypothetical protein